MSDGATWFYMKQKKMPKIVSTTVQFRYEL